MSGHSNKLIVIWFGAADGAKITTSNRHIRTCNKFYLKVCSFSIRNVYKIELNSALLGFCCKKTAHFFSHFDYFIINMKIGIYQKYIY